MIYSSCDNKTFEISFYHTKKRHFWSLLDIYPDIYLSTSGYISQKIHSKSIFVGQPTLYDQRFTRYGKSCNFVIIRPRNTKYCIFVALLVVRGVYISQTTHSKSSIAVILRDQPVFDDQRFATYGFWAMLGSLDPIFGQKNCFAHLSA